MSPHRPIGPHEQISAIPDGGWALVVFADRPTEWYVRPPGTTWPASIKHHTVTEHDDGTITVTPSIGYSTPDRDDYWHGYLEHGVWRQV